MIERNIILELMIKIKSNIIKGKNNTNKFRKYVSFENINDYERNRILRDYRFEDIPLENKKEFVFLEYIIWECSKYC